jgi:hypothetical protein
VTEETATYPTLRRRLWAVRGRLAFRAAARAVRLGRTAGERRLAAFLAAAAVALAVLAAAAALGVPPAVGVPAVLIGFGLVLLAGLLFIGGPPDDVLLAERDDLTAALPAAKQAWEEERRKAREEAAARKEAAPQPTPAVVPVLTDEVVAPPPVVELIPAAAPAMATPPPGDWLKGDGSFSLRVVGESYHQRALEEISTGLTWVGENRIVPAVLRLEDSQYDRYAVAVVIAGRKVGHLSRADARAFRLRVAGEGRVGPEYPCRAMIREAWDRRGRGSYGVRLDVCLYA